MKTLYLYGPPASGKSFLARQLAREFGRRAIDLDEEIVRRAGKSIPEIFASAGEEGFRRLESETLRKVSAPIVALGGGTLLDVSNRAFAEDNGFVIVLDTDPDEIRRRIASSGDERPLGDRFAERRAHYASFPHHLRPGDRLMLPRPLRGAVTVPVSKSHLHRILIARYLATGTVPADQPADCADILATKRCLRALASGERRLDCGESGSTLRFLAPLAAAKGIKAEFIRRGRLAERPMIAYEKLESGLHTLPGNVSSQFVTGLLFALPLLAGDSRIRFSSPLESSGYVEMTLDVIRRFGIDVHVREDGFDIPGGQVYRDAEIEPEGDWSAAAFWYAANALGSELTIKGLSPSSHQPDDVCRSLMDRIRSGRPDEIDVRECPDLYPALRLVAALLNSPVSFTGTERLRLKESDRIAAMDDLLASPDDVDTKGDHRIAMAAAIGSTVADGPVLIHNADCVAKSYPNFFDVFRMDLLIVTGWPLLKTSSPDIHNAASAAEGRRAEMIAYPAETIDEALAFADQADVRGLAVTIPHKTDVMSRLDEIDATARAIGAVNTVVRRDGRYIGYNTDADGFAEAFLAFAGSPAGRTVTLLGDGGAAKAVRYALERLSARVVTCHRTTPAPASVDLLVNATPVDPIPDYAFTGRETVYDLRYVPEETPLMARARKAGCRVMNGLSMLRAQARLQRLKFFAALSGILLAAVAVAAPFPEKGGTIRFNGGNAPKSYNAYTDNNSYTAMTFSLMYESLLDSDPDTLDFVGAIASAWTVSEDGATFSFTLDPRASWSDGRPITATDVKWTFDAIMDPKNDTGPWKAMLGGFNSPETDGARVIFTKRGDEGRDWRDLMTLATFPILPAHVFAGTDFACINLVNAPVSGPYRLARVEPEIECELVRHGRWWRQDLPECCEQCNFDRILIRYYAENSNAFEAFGERKLDVFPVYTARIMAEETKGDDYARNWILRRRFRNHAPIGFQGFAMNSRRAPFDDVRVRRAMAKLLDRERLNATLMFNEYFLLDSYYADIWDDAHPCPNEHFSFDPEGARALLAEAGYPDGFAFTFLSRSAMEDRFLAPFAEELQKLGVRMEIVRKDFAGWMRDMDSFNYDMTWASWGAGVFKQPESMWLSTEADRRGSNNITGFKSFEVDALIKAEKTMMTMGERLEAYRQIDALIAAEVPYVLLWQVAERRILYWNKFGLPKGGLSRFGDEDAVLRYWWYDPDRADELSRAMEEGDCLPHVPEIVEYDKEIER